MAITFRPARREELPAILAMYASARLFMRENGNPHQGGDHYPSRETVEGDLARGTLYVATEGEELLAVFSFEIGREPVYEEIDGAWLGARERYGFLHRLAVVRRGGGVGGACLAFCYGQGGGLRIDTHADNLPMQSLLKKHGFSYCGIVDYGASGTRLAYERL